MSAGDFESAFIKVGGSKTKEGLSVEEASEESLGNALFWLPRNLIGKKPRLWLTGKPEERGALEKGSRG